MVCNMCPYLCQDNYCAKIDSKIYDYQCEEEKNMINQKSINRKKLNRYERNMKYKRKLKRIADNPTKYPAGAYYKTDLSYLLYSDSVNLYRIPYREWVKDNAKYIKRSYRANHAPGYSGFLKKQASRKFRRYKGELQNGSSYKKIFDYWWELT